jgi:TolB-like protein/DNA-binding winged helix-turn-helix (wHTH) protein
VDTAVSDKGAFEFGPFRLDPARRQLTRDGALVKLPAKQLDTLLYLLGNAGRVVEKDELFASVWPGRMVEESSLTQAIFLLRRALQADEAEPYIITAPGRGYRFVANVVHVAAGAGSMASAGFSPGPHTAPAPAGPVQPGSAPARVLSRRFGASAQMVLIGAAVVLALLTVSALALWRGSGPAQSPDFAPPPHSVAVLAFTNMSGDPAQAYFSDGLSEELINTLGRIDTLQVAARMSAFTFRDGKSTVGEIARKLNVGAVLDGSVRRDGQRLRITVHLINAVTGFELWSHSYDRNFSDILGLQSDIAEAIAGSLKVTLLADTAARLTVGGTENASAFDAYLRGAKLMQGISRAGAHAALAAFDEAIRFDPSYANAYAGRSAALSQMASYWDNDADLVAIDTDAALAAADRAVALAPGSPYAHTVRGNALLMKTDFAEAAEEQTLAHRLGPEDAFATRGYALIQCMLGHRGQAEAASRHMLELDPLRPSLYHDRAQIQNMDRNYDDALETMRQEQALGEDDLPFSRAYIAWVHLAQNRPQLAEQDCKPGCAWPEFDNALIAYKLGRVAEAQVSLDKLHELHKKHHENPFPDDAEIYAQWGEPAKALAALRNAGRAVPLRWIRVAPFLDPIRNTPEFKQIEASLHLPP